MLDCSKCSMQIVHSGAGNGGTGHYSYAMSARWQRCLLPAAAAATAGKVSKFISNNYVAINKPMPAIKGGRRVTGVGRVVRAGNCRACSALFMQQISEEGDRRQSTVERKSGQVSLRIVFKHFNFSIIQFAIVVWSRCHSSAVSRRLSMRTVCDALRILRDSFVCHFSMAGS